MESDASAAHRIISELSQNPNATATCNRAVAEMLEDLRWVFCQGEIRDLVIVKRKVNTKIYDISTKARP